MSSFFNKNKSIEGTKVEYLPEEGIVRFERDDEVKAFANKEVLEEFSKHNEMPIFKGSVENGYESDFLGYKDKCPLCNTPTQQMYSNFIWTNQLKSRILSAPVGYFCPNCPTVIIDDELVKKSIDKKRVLGTC